MIDYIGIGLIFILGLASFFFFMRKQTSVNIRVKVTDQDVLYAWSYPRSSYADRFIKGDVENDGLGRVLSEIIDVETFNIDSQRKAVYLDVLTKTTYDKRSGLYYAKGKPLIYGASLRFNFKSVIFDGIVTELPEPYRQKFYDFNIYEVRVLLKGINYYNNRDTTQGILGLSYVEPEIVKSIKKGDKILDSKDETLFEVVDLVVKPSIRIVTNDRGDVFKVNDPVYVDGLITLKARVKVIRNQVYVLDDTPLKINENLPLIFDNLSVYPLIISFKKI